MWVAIAHFRYYFVSWPWYHFSGASNLKPPVPATQHTSDRLIIPVVAPCITTREERGQREAHMLKCSNAEVWTADIRRQVRMYMGMHAEFSLSNLV